MARKPKTPQLTTPGILFTITVYILLLPWLLTQSITEVTGHGISAMLMVYVVITLTLIAFEFFHVDEYTKQRGIEYNIAGVLTFFMVTIMLINHSAVP